jgi:hypothetical protein
VREDTDLNVYETFVSEVPLTVVPTEVLRTLVNESKKNGGWAGPIQDAESFLPTESPVIYFMVTSHFTQQARRVEPKEKGGYLPISLQEQMDADLIVAHLEDGSTLTIKDRNRTS